MRIAVRLIEVSLAYAILTILVKALTGYFSTFEQMSLRCALALLILVPTEKSWSQWSVREIAVALTRGLFLTVIGGGAWILAMDSTRLNIISFISCMPYEALWGVILFKERFSSREISGLLVSIAGVGLLSGVKIDDIASSLNWGVLLALGSGIGWGLGIALGKLHHAKLSDLTVTRLTLLSSIFWSGAGMGVSSTPWNMTDDLMAWALLSLSSLVLVWGSWLMHKVLREASLSDFSLFGLSQPVFTAFLSYLIFGEKLFALEIAGAALIGVGLAIYATKHPYKLQLLCDSGQFMVKLCRFRRWVFSE